MAANNTPKDQEDEGRGKLQALREMAIRRQDDDRTTPWRGGNIYTLLLFFFVVVHVPDPATSALG